MLRIENGFFALETEHTGYYIGLRGPLAETLHYGARIHADREALREKIAVPFGTDVAYSTATDPAGLAHLCLELTPPQKGDIRPGALALRGADGCATAELSFAAAHERTGSVPPKGMPAAYGGEKTLCLEFASPTGVGVTL